MSTADLPTRVEACRIDYQSTTGKPFEHFFCPILMRDEPADLCRGHIINAAFSTCGKWVPQRRDLDAFYGSVVEADLISAVEDRAKDPRRMLFDSTLRRKHRPRLEFEGKDMGFYFPKTDNIPSQHTLVHVEDREGNKVCNFAMKVAHEQMLAIDGKEIQVVVERDFRPPVIASILKAAHLTLFRMLGYRHVFSPTGIYAADILRQFFDRYRTPRSVAQEDVYRYFIRHETMISPIIIPDENLLRGTVEDNRFLSCFSTRDEVFAIGVIVRAGRDAFCVFLPTDCGSSINTYFSFIAEPPVAVSARVTRFNRDRGVFEIPPGKPMMVPLGQPAPHSAV